MYIAHMFPYIPGKAEFAHLSKYIICAYSSGVEENAIHLGKECFY